MSTPDERIEQIIAAASAGQLTPGEQMELDRLCVQHPWIVEEIASLRAIAERVGAAESTWAEVAVTDALRERVLRDIPPSPRRDAGGAGAGTADHVRVRVRRRWVTPLLAAACLILGLAIGFATPALRSMPPAGPPGTLGAVEPIDLRDEAPGVELEADLVAHTWGTEAVLDASGLEVGSTYTLVFIAENGTEFSAGQVLGSQVPIHCRVNAAVLRQDAVRFEVRDSESSVVALADLPHV